MPTFTPLFSALCNEGWFVSVVATHEKCITVQCLMFSRDYDEETGYTDIVFGDTVCAPGSLHCVAKFHGLFELQHSGPAMLVEEPLIPSSKKMPSEMAAAIGALITPENFPRAAEFMEPEAAYPEDEDARVAFWASINQQISSMTAAGDPWGALKLQTEAVNKLIGWVDPPPSPSRSIPEANLEDMVPPSYSLVEAADAGQSSLVEAADAGQSSLVEAVYADEDEDEYEDEYEEKPDEYLPVGSHLLPEEFQSFLRSWNQTIEASTGDWIGEPRQAYKAQNPEQWAQFSLELKRLSRLYAADVAAVKAYQQAQEA